jgi:hypothetical protein
MGKLTIPASLKAGWDSLDPKFQTKVLAVAKAVPHDSILVYGKRTMDEQQALYNQGRDAQGKVVDASKIVTKAAPGLSPHNWGLGADLLPVNPATGKGDWNYDAGFKAMSVEAKKQGLNSGYTWKFKDAPHLEDPSFTVAKAKEWLRGAGTAISKVATSKTGIIGAGAIVVGLLTMLAISIYNRQKGESQ